MEHRYSLRFESGERRGETIPILASGFTVGRRPGNSLQVLDNSVSGQHAEFRIDEQGVTVKDLGSTNGTRVGELRILEQRLAHGDHVTLGNIEFVLLDERMGGAKTALEALAKTRTVPGPDGVQRVSAEVVARSKKVSRPGLVVVALALVAGGVWWYLNRGGGSAGPVLRAPNPVAGDLLADEFSFESERDTWSSAENAPQAFFRSTGARASGAVGVACELGAGEWALSRSRDVLADAGREFVSRAVLRASEGVDARLGIEFARASDGAATGVGTIVAWSAAATDGDFAEREVQALVPPGYDVARAVLFARASEAGGSAAADDVSLVERAAESGPAAQVAEFRLIAQGTPARQALLVKGDRVLLSGIEFTKERSAPGWDSAAIECASDATRITIDARGTHEVVVLRVEPTVVAGGIATLGGAGSEGGYKTHGSTFERAGVQDLLLGGKGDFVRLSLAAPARVTGVAEGAASRITVAGSVGKLVMQLDFKEERTKAGDLAFAARDAEKKGALGDCLAQWSTLLDTYPYEESLVAEAESTRARLLEQGLNELRSVRAQGERARFFRLVDLYRQCRDKALAIGRRYAKSEVERAAQTLADEVEGDLSGLEADLDRVEHARLAAILQVLEAQKASGLAGEVRAYLDDRTRKN